MDLAGKTLFITGASRGIGLAIATRAAHDGANVVVAAKTTETNPKLPGTIYSAAEAIEAAGGKALPLQCDIRDEASVQAAEEPRQVGTEDMGPEEADEGHVEPRRILPELHARFVAAGGTLKFNSDVSPDAFDGIAIDCRGLAARATQQTLRGVKGEMIIVESDEIELARPIRLIHPRWPLYVIPRGGNRFMLGATSIESEDNGVSVRSALELLSAAYAVHPAFAEARIVEFGSGLRPAFPDNLPRISIDKNRILVNGLYRHGFLIAPALAELTLAYVDRGQIDNEVMQCV